MSEPTIRDATVDDVPAIRRIAESAWSEAYGDVLAPETIETALAEWYQPESTRELVARSNVTYFVAEADGVVGYLSGAESDEAGVATLGAIYVDPERWGEGVGTALLERFHERCADWGFDAVRLRVLAENDVGRSFYRARGYECAAEREVALFDETVAECVYRRELD